MRVPRPTPLLLLATLTAAGAAAAAGYGLTAPRHYRATAQMLVVPVPAADSTFTGLDVLRDVSGKPRAAETAAVLVRSPQVADAVRTQLGIRRSISSLLDEVGSQVVGSSNVVAVSADDTTAVTAAQVANAFVDALIAQRTTAFQHQLAGAIRRDSQLLAGKPPAGQAAELSRRIAVLRSFQGQPDPTLRRAATAVVPTAAVWPVLWSLVLVGAGIGLGAGVLVALALTLLPGGGGVARAGYARFMSDRAVNALVDRLEQRLAARESALAVRERELQARIDELRALEARDDVAQLRALQAKEAELEERERALLSARDDSSQADALRAREAELEARERELARREAMLRAVAEASNGMTAREEALQAREAELAERVAAVTRRELAVARAHASAVVPAPTARDNSSQAPAPAPAAAAARPAARRGAFTLPAIEQLVRERGPEFPERRDEWESTVYFLREYAEHDGRLPSGFDWLVEDTFAPILD